MFILSSTYFFFFFNDTATTEIYTLSLHDALPISYRVGVMGNQQPFTDSFLAAAKRAGEKMWQMPLDDEYRDMIKSSVDRKSTRLNSSHLVISYAVFCLKKKKNKTTYMSSSITIHP